MKFINFTIFLLIFLALSCNTDSKLGDPCSLLTDVSEHVTKLEQKNLDCMTVDSDALCISDDGGNSYCTQKCGPERTCYNEVTKKGDVICSSTETCINAICYDSTKTCSPENLNGLCEEGKTCDAGTCKSVCLANEVYLNGICTLETLLCSPQNLNGVCDKGLACSEEGICTATGCPDEYTCKSPIQLLGHPLKGMFVCVKTIQEETK